MADDARRRNDALLCWYADNARSLPWRDERGEVEPWRVLVVEVMAQQTQVNRVAERWEAFLTRFPTPRALADAPPEDAVRLWGGLGYLRRLHNLRRAAALIAERGWPNDLTELPGVGRYTAAAVACFAHGAAVPTVDTNHRRVLSRWAGRPLDGAELWTWAGEALDTSRPAAWNQAVMDLGATVCLRLPDCGRCPVATWCAGPTVYSPPARQSRFVGSLRQTRAAVVRALADGPMTTSELRDALGAGPAGEPGPEPDKPGGEDELRPERQLGRALSALQRDAMVVETDAGWRLV